MESKSRADFEHVDGAPDGDARARREQNSTGDHDDAAARMRRLEKENAALQQRLEFVEELVGPTEAQRRSMQDQLIAARAAAIRAKYRGAAVPIKVAGRLDESLLWASGLSERDAGLLQGGCLPDEEGILQDVSLLGDPMFRPYEEKTGEPRWQARGGMLQMSLDEVRTRFGDDIAQDVVRCAQELDEHDASRRVGIELPWHPVEDRELQPAEIIDLLDRELSLQTNLLCGGGGGCGSSNSDARVLAPCQAAASSSSSRPLLMDDRDRDRCRDRSEYWIPTTTAPSALSASAAAALAATEAQPSPYAVVNLPRRRGNTRTARSRRKRQMRSASAGAGVGAGTSSSSSGAVVPLPPMESTRRLAADPTPASCRPSGGASRPLGGAARCGGIPGLLRPRMQESLDSALLSCATERGRLL